MIEDQETVQWLNLVHTSPTFAIRVGHGEERSNVLSLDMIPKGDGEYWVCGVTILKNGTNIPSVFRVNTDTGGDLIGVYWNIRDKWWDFQDRPSVLTELSMPESEIFPFDWEYSITLEEDSFHSSDDNKNKNKG